MVQNIHCLSIIRHDAKTRKFILGKRIDTVNRYIRFFSRETISDLVADREFIGEDWMEYLNGNLTENIKSFFSLQSWMQPKELDFNSSDSFFGGAVDCKLQYKFPLIDRSGLSALSADVGVIAKTKGFMTGEAKLDSHVGLYVGLSVFME